MLLVQAPLLRDRGELLRRRDAHFVRDRRRSHVEGPTEDPWEPEAVVHLVREVGAARGNHAGSRLLRLPGPDLGHRVRNREQDRVVRHGGDPILLDDPGAGPRGRDHDVRAPHRLRDPAFPVLPVRDLSELPFLPERVLRVLEVLAVRAQEPLRIDEAKVAGPCAGRDEDLRGPDVRGPRADEGDRDLGELLPDDLQRVERAGDVDRRGPLLVVVPHRDVRLLPEAIEDAKALRLGDVLEVHPAEGRGEPLHELDDLLRVFRRNGDGERVDASEILEQERLPLHHGQPCLRADVAEAQDARAVRDNRDVVPLVRQLPDLERVRLDLQARLRDAGRIPDRKIVVPANRDLGDDLHLPLVEGMVLRGELLREVRPPELLSVRDLGGPGGGKTPGFRCHAAARSDAHHPNRQ